MRKDIEATYLRSLKTTLGLPNNVNGHKLKLVLELNSFEERIIELNNNANKIKNEYKNKDKRIFIRNLKDRNHMLFIKLLVKSDHVI